MKVKILIAVALSAFSFACADSTVDENNQTNNSNSTNNNVKDRCLDIDGDGYKGRTPGCPLGKDCNDASAGTNPGASEFCGDRLDNNCDGQTDENCKLEEKKCTDNDGDRYGVGEGCLGLDCNDNDFNINPRATEICGNSIDEDCKNGDEVCPANCTDADGDGYGTAGSTDCAKTEEDCDDTNAGTYPGATEICNSRDDDCDGNVDECAFNGQSCVGGKCQGGVNVQCDNNDDCIGQNSQCDASQNPKVCRISKDGSCTASTECLDGLSCVAGKCSGDWCANNTCSGAYNVCDPNNNGCVQCPYFNGNATADTACVDNKVCSGSGWCSLESVYPYQDWEDLMTINIDLAACWIGSQNGAKSVCFTYVTNASTITITKAAAKGAWKSGTYDAFYTAEIVAALDEIWGKRIFNLEDIDWNKDIEANLNREMCLWYEPGSTFKEETMVLDLCANFTP